MDPDVFYWIGGALAALAVIVSFLGLRMKDFPASRGPLIGTIAVFALLVVATTTYAVVNARDHQAHFREELAHYAEEHEAEEAEAAEAEATGEEGPDAVAPTEAEQAAAEEGGPISMVEYAFVPPEVTAREGDTLEAPNEGQIAHNLTLFDGDEELVGTEDVEPGGTGEVTLDVAPGEYRMVCTLPGHEELGMTGTITIE